MSKTQSHIGIQTKIHGIQLQIMIQYVQHCLFNPVSLSMWQNDSNQRMKNPPQKYNGQQINHPTHRDGLWMYADFFVTSLASNKVEAIGFGFLFHRMCSHNAVTSSVWLISVFCKMPSTQLILLPIHGIHFTKEGACIECEWVCMLILCCTAWYLIACDLSCRITMHPAGTANTSDTAEDGVVGTVTPTMHVYPPTQTFTKLWGCCVFFLCIPRWLKANIECMEWCAKQ